MNSVIGSTVMALEQQQAKYRPYLTLPAAPQPSGQGSARCPAACPLDPPRQGSYCQDEEKTQAEQQDVMNNVFCTSTRQHT